MDEQPEIAYDEQDPRPRRGRRWVAGTTAAALALTGVGIGAGVAYAHRGRTAPAATGTTTPQADTWGAPPSRPQQLQQQPGWSNRGPAYSGVASTAATSGSKATAGQLTGLVRIATTLKYDGGKAAGTGLVLTSDGEVVTNHHVVAGATRIVVTVMSTGQKYRATVVGTDATDDVAVLRLRDATGLSTVTTSTAPAAVGDAVTAVGDANGLVHRLSAAEGSVVALHRNITTTDETDGSTQHLRGLIEISNDVISGDSGGATYDASGEVVGMTTAASSGGNDVVGYAIPIATVLRIADALESHTNAARYTYGRPAFLGLALPGDGTTTAAGVYPGTPAAAAGLVAGDTVTAVDGTRTPTAAALRRFLATHQPGDRVSVTWTDTGGGSHISRMTLKAGAVR